MGHLVPKMVCQMSGDAGKLGLIFLGIKFCFHKARYQVVLLAYLIMQTVFSTLSPFNNIIKYPWARDDGEIVGEMYLHKVSKHLYGKNRMERIFSS